MQNQPTLIEQMVNFFASAFRFQGLDWKLILIAVGLGLLFGLIWLLAYWPPLRRKPGLVAIAAIGAFLTWTAIAFIQIPLQAESGQALIHFWSQTILSTWLLLAGIPSILLSGLVQEGSKLVPVVVYWWLHGHRLDYRTGLIAGAMAGAGFGIFEAVWVHNTIFASGWNWQLVQANGPLALIGFWERFFTVGFHIAVSALAGYGLARDLGWQFYLLASVLHGALNYAVVLLQKGLLNNLELEVYVAVFALAVSAWVWWLLWRKIPDRLEDSPD